MPVGRDLSDLVLGRVDQVNDPIYFMSDDDPSRGLDQENIFGVAYDSVTQPSHIESVIVKLNEAIWKFSRYFDNPQFWSDPAPWVGLPKDEVIRIDDSPMDVPGEYEVSATKRVKYTPELDEFELYNLTQDPMELDNLYGRQDYEQLTAYLASILERQRSLKRLAPISGEVPGNPYPT
jgi:choline-sulfatase